MAYNIEISKEAQIELDVAQCFFKTKNIDHDFLKDFARQIQFLKTTPFSFQVKYKTVRILCFDNFNYSIHYVVINESVIILRILNQKQDF